MYAASHRIPTENVDLLVAKVAKLNARVAKAKITGGVTVTPAHEQIFDRRGYTWVTFQSSAAFKVEGWTFVARYDFEVDADHKPVVFLHTIPGVDVPVDRRVSDGHCDHCNAKRFRKNTFLVVSETGDYKVVGRSCLKEFFGISAETLASMFEWVRSPADVVGEFEDHIPGMRAIEYTSNASVLAAACAVTSVAGWVSGAKARESDVLTSTASHVHSLLNPPSPSSHRDALEAHRRLVEHFPVTADHRSDADLIVVLVRAAADGSEYIEKLVKIVNAGHVSNANFNVLVSAVTLLIKHRQIKRVEPTDVPDVVEGRMILNVEVVSVREEPGYTYNSIVTKMLVRDADGRKFWGSAGGSATVGEKLTMKATITKSDRDPKFGFFKRPTFIETETSA